MSDEIVRVIQLLKEVWKGKVLKSRMLSFFRLLTNSCHIPQAIQDTGQFNLMGLAQESQMHVGSNTSHNKPR